ncbi:MAG TPA: molybdopterin-dependent oxidoreductase [Gammaproteobacteria bacterium]|nr:molybdopterin-dependent oxidoreductase [Gammaproteobacteria bacterium]
MSGSAVGDAVRTTCPYCGVGCGLRVERAAAGGEPTIEADPDHPANFGRICSKGAALGDTLGLEGRLLYPEIRGRRASWDEALDAVASGFRRAVDAHGPDSVAFYVSGQLLTEDYYVANKLMKGFIGSANIDTNSRLCMASAVAGYKRAFGTDTVPNDYADLEVADLIVLVGSNLAWCHPVLYQRVVQAKTRNASLRVVVIDPRRTATCDGADLFLQIRPGTDVLLFNGLLNHLRRDDALDWEFLDAHTEGFGAAMSVAKESAPSVPVVASACGLDEDDVLEFYRWFARTPRTVTAFSQGVNQSTSGTDKVNAIVNVHLATGRIGKPGAGPFSLTGQPNAMGGREVGGLANQLAAHMDFAPESVERVRRFWHAPRIATVPGLKAVDLFDALDAGRIKAIWIMATNPVVSMPDAERVRRALARCELVVVSDCVRETDTTACAHVLLPAATWGEKSGTVTNSERRIARQRQFLRAPGESRADWWIVAQVARRMGFGAQFDYRCPADIFREHARLSAFENAGARAFDIGACAELTDAEYDALEPFQWPRPVRDASLRPFADGRFFTRSGKAQFVATVPRAPAHRATPEYPLVLNTGRIRDQWHTMTRTGRSARLMGHSPEPFVLVHPLDAARFGLAAGDLAEVRSATGRVVVRAEVGDGVAPGHVFAPMHWSAQFASLARVGGLIAAAADPVSGQPELKHTPVSVRRYEPAWHGFALSREPLAIDGCAYLARARGQGYWRYELAGEHAPASWADWADAVLGPRAERVELIDSAGRYRGARVVAERLQACVFVARSKALPSRTWLAGLFNDDALSDATRLAILSGRPSKPGLETGPIVCSCFSIGRSTLLRAIRTQDLVSAEAIGTALRAGTNCGSCVPELKALLAEAAGEGAATGGASVDA